jgi:UDP-N-acetylmuramoylalanine-D-glutamate ligase
MEPLANQRVLILGLGVSGRNAANFCAARGARVLAADERNPDHDGEFEGLDPRVEQAIGQPFPDSRDFDLVVPAPAYRWNATAIARGASGVISNSPINSWVRRSSL